MCHYRLLRSRTAMHVIFIMLAFPVSNAKLERAFSAMARNKTDWRNRLGENTTECLLRISLEGPELQEFDATKEQSD